MFEITRKLIKDMGLENKYRVSFNGGSLLEVHHLHMHLLGGELNKKALL